MSNSKTNPEGGEDLGLGGAPSAESQTANTPPASGAGTGQGGKTKPEQGKRKMGLVTFIQLAEPNKYVQAILKNKRSMEAHTKDEWEQIVKYLLEQKVN
jgi:hypothetical protein